MSANATPESRDALKLAIEESLAKTCSLNRTMYAKFSASWTLGIADGPLAARWWVDYILDDFGRLTVGGIGGSLGQPRNAETFTGEIEEMPPDKFRRETSQPIPAPVVVKPKETNRLGLTHAQRVSVKGKDA